MNTSHHAITIMRYFMNKIKKNLFFISIMTFSALSILVFVLYSNVKQNASSLLKGECFAQFIKLDKTENTLAKIDFYLNFNEKGFGYIDMSGKLNAVNSGIIARSYKFRYNFHSENMIHLSQIQQTKRAADNADENLMKKMILSIDTKPGLYVKVTKLLNSYVIGNVYSPLFICVIKGD